MLRTGRRTVSTSVRDNAEITIVENCRRKRRNALPRILSSGQRNDQRVGYRRLWQNGQALVSCDVKASCSSCASRAGCGSRVLNKLGPQTTHTIVVPCDEPLVPGQKVELGIAEGSLLSSALLVYMSPLVGLFLIASLFQLLFASDVAALCGAILGGIGGFLIARGYSRKFAARAEWQPIILSVALPPGLVRFETSSEDASQ